MNEGDPIDIGRQALARPLDRRLIAVDTNQSAAAQTLRDLGGMTAETERAVNINAVRIDIQIRYALVQKDGDMSAFSHQKSSSSMAAAIFSGVASESYTLCHVSLSHSSAWLLQPMTVTFFVRLA